MGTLNLWTGLDSAARPGKGNRNSVAKRSSVANRPITAKRSLATSQVELAEGSLKARERFFHEPLANTLYSAMNPVELRGDRVLRLKGEIAAGRYNVSSSELADCLLNIARSDIH